MRKLLFFLLLPVLLAGCQAGQTEEEHRTKLESQVMDIHDEAMAEMGTIYKLRRNLTRLRDTLQVQDTDTAVIQELTTHIVRLNQADEAMMNWMRQYKIPDGQQSHELTMHYLQDELSKMRNVKQLMDSTIVAARQTYSKHEPKQ
jgi:hypothetical protein